MRRAISDCGRNVDVVFGEVDAGLELSYQFNERSAWLERRGG